MEKSRHRTAVSTTSQNNSNPGNSSNDSSPSQPQQEQQPIIIDRKQTMIQNNDNDTTNNTNQDLSPEHILPLTIMNNIRDMNNANKNKRNNRGSSNGNNSGSGGSGNNSDNSALISLGNNSFGFNFDSEETYGITNTNGVGAQSDPSETNDSDDAVKVNSGGGSGKMKGGVRFELPSSNNGTSPTRTGSSAIVPPSTTTNAENNSMERRQGQVPNDIITSASPSQQRPSANNPLADAAVRGLKMIVTSNASKWNITKDSKKQPHRGAGGTNKNPPSSSSTVGASSTTDVTKPLSCPSSSTTTTTTTTLSGSKHDRDYDSDGYDSDNEAPRTSQPSQITPLPTPSSKPPPPHPPKNNKKSKKMDELKREERNAREKERSFRITRQINDLRDLLSSGGVIVPKGTKSSVLTEAANYIRLLQQHQYRSELERHRLVQQLQIVGSGSMGAPAATAVRHVAAQNGVWSLGNFGGVPPRSAMTFYQQPQQQSQQQQQQPQQQPQQQIPIPQAPQMPGAAGPPPQPQMPQQDVQQISKIENHEYRHVFNSCTVAMAIVSMGGAFIDCNDLFCKLSQYTKQEVCAMTIFNLTSRIDLQNAFDLISQMISPGNTITEGTAAPQDESPPSCLLRGAMKNNRSDLGLSVALIKGDEGVAKCFCVTLVTGVNSNSPYGALRPVPATVESLKQQQRERQQVGATTTTGEGERNKTISDNMTSAAYTTG